MKAFIERVELYPEKRKDGCWIKKIVFNFPVPVNGEEVRELPLENETMREMIVLMSKESRKKRCLLHKGKTMKDSVRNNSLDAFRIIASIFVVFIHVPFPGRFGESVQTLGRFSVPFFLLISGYYCTEDNVKKNIISVLKLIVFSCAFYCVLNCSGSIIRGEGIWGWLSSHLTPEALLKFLLCNRAYFISSISYYLFMLLYVYIVILILQRFGVTQECYSCFPLLLVGSVILTYLNVEWYYCGNWLMTGLPFFALGKAIRMGKYKIGRPVFVIILGIAAALIEARIVSGDKYLGIGAIMLSVGIFQWCLQNPGAISNNFAVWGRRMSLFVFIFHCGVRDVLKNTLKISEWMLPSVVLTISIVCSVLAYMVLERVKKAVQRKKSGDCVL